MPHLNSAKNQDRRAALGQPAIKITGGLELVCGRPTLALSSALVHQRNNRVFYDNFSYFSLKPYVVIPHLNRLVETDQMRGHNICFYAELTKDTIPYYHQILPLIYSRVINPLLTSGSVHPYPGECFHFHCILHRNFCKHTVKTLIRCCIMYI